MYMYMCIHTCIYIYLYGHIGGDEAARGRREATRGGRLAGGHQRHPGAAHGRLLLLYSTLLHYTILYYNIL